MDRTFEKALIVGGSRGCGRELALAIADQGTETIVVSRTDTALNELKARDPGLQTISMDAATDGAASSLLQAVDPDLLVLTAGAEPEMAPFHEQTWTEFSRNWNVDTRIAHAFSSAALTQPMRSGGVVVSFSSGAGLAGSRLSGGYAGAKRMQHFLADYAQREAELLGLDLTFYSIVPSQPIDGSILGQAAVEAYSAAVGKSLTEFRKQWDEPLTASKISAHVMKLLRQSGPRDARVFSITGTGMVECD
ncbi:SDR family NAD(P)-dependent oxidoreductase [Anderseniella sp. Alg231-50]|uniref:SDR family NAD(P)-dependent oxidoreductase n=1 Tax=Anderseniella sp. Alg231-50 TaxID=1922226 RepID=UPI000D5605B1